VGVERGRELSSRNVTKVRDNALHRKQDVTVSVKIERKEGTKRGNRGNNMIHTYCVRWTEFRIAGLLDCAALKSTSPLVVVAVDVRNYDLCEEIEERGAWIIRMKKKMCRGKNRMEEVMDEDEQVVDVEKDDEDGEIVKVNESL
jgi:hypothetical protein